MALGWHCVLTNESGDTLETKTVHIISKAIVIDSIIYEVLDESSVAVTGYSGASAVLSVPTSITIDGVTYTVTEIAERAFYQNTTMTSISLPNTIIAIRKQAFAGCSNLSSMTNHD